MIHKNYKLPNCQGITVPICSCNQSGIYLLFNSFVVKFSYHFRKYFCYEIERKRTFQKCDFVSINLNDELLIIQSDKPNEQQMKEKEQLSQTKSLIIYQLKLNQKSKAIRFSGTNKICQRTLFLFSLRSAHYVFILLNNMQVRIARLALEVSQNKNNAYLDQILPIAPLFNQSQTYFNFKQCNFHLIPQPCQIYVEFYKIQKMLKFDLLISYDEFYVAQVRWFPISKQIQRKKLPIFRTISDSTKLESFYAGYLQFQQDAEEILDSQSYNRLTLKLLSNQGQKRRFDLKKNEQVIGLIQKKDRVYLIYVSLIQMKGQQVVDCIKMSYIDLNQLRLVHMEDDFDLNSDEDIAKFVLMSNSQAIN